MLRPDSSIFFFFFFVSLYRLSQAAPIVTFAMGDSDNFFGPKLPNVFDFTLVFEQGILSLLPTCLFLCLAPFRMRYLLRKETVVGSSRLLWSKLVIKTSPVGVHIVGPRLILQDPRCCLLFSANSSRGIMESPIYHQVEDVNC